MFLKLIALAAAAIPVILFLRSLLGRRPRAPPRRAAGMARARRRDRADRVLDLLLRRGDLAPSRSGTAGACPEADADSRPGADRGERFSRGSVVCRTGRDLGRPAARR